MTDFSSIVWCSWCRDDAGRTSALAPCCIARRMSKMVPANRMRALDDVRKELGAPAAQAMRRAVLQSMAMRIAKLRRDERSNAYQRALRDGWLPDDLEALKNLTKAEFERGQANGR